MCTNSVNISTYACLYVTKYRRQIVHYEYRLQIDFVLRNTKVVVKL